MADTLKLRGGTTTQNASFTGADREVTVDTEKKTLVVHDGTNAGGTPLMKESGGNAAPSVGIGTGGTNAIAIDSNQNVGIGEGSPANKLHVKVDDVGLAPHVSAQIALERNGTNYLQFLTANNGTSGLLFGDSDDTDGTKIVYDHNTKLMQFTVETATACVIDNRNSITRFLQGITSSRLVGNTDCLHQIEGTGSTTGLSITRNSQTTTHSPKLVFGKSAGTSTGSDAAVAENHVLGEIRFSGADGSDLTNHAASILALVDGNVDTNEVPGRLEFKTTADGNSDPTTRLTIDSTGLVKLPDNGKFTAGNNTDLEIFHNGTNNIIQSDVGDLQINSGNSAGDVVINVNNNVNNDTRETSAKFKKNAGVELYYNGNGPKLETTSSGVDISGSSPTLRVVGASSTPSKLTLSSAGITAWDFICNESANSALTFNKDDSTKFTIDTNGNILVGTTQTSLTTSVFGHILFGDGTVEHSRNADGTNATFQAYGNAGSLRIMGDGDAENTNNSYGSISDETLKQDIVDAASQWNDIKNLRVRKFRFKDNPTGALQIGVVAQEIEKVSAGLVKEDSEGIKSVKYSILYMKAVKCLQEAMTKIETLETKVAALEAA